MLTLKDDRIKLALSAIVIPVACSYLYFLQSGYKYAPVDNTVTSTVTTPPAQSPDNKIAVENFLIQSYLSKESDNGTPALENAQMEGTIIGQNQAVMAMMIATKSDKELSNVTIETDKPEKTVTKIKIAAIATETEKPALGFNEFTVSNEHEIPAVGSSEVTVNHKSESSHGGFTHTTAADGPDQPDVKISSTQLTNETLELVEKVITNYQINLTPELIVKNQHESALLKNRDKAPEILIINGHIQQENFVEKSRQYTPLELMLITKQENAKYPIMLIGTNYNDNERNTLKESKLILVDTIVGILKSEVMPNNATADSGKSDMINRHAVGIKKSLDLNKLESILEEDI